MPGEEPRPQVLAVGSNEHGDYVKPHRHSGPELIYTVSGTSETRCSGHPGPLPGRPGLLQVIPADVEHDQRRRGCGRTIYVVLRPFPGHGLRQPQVFDVGCGSCEARWMRDILALGDGAPQAETATVQGHLVMALFSRLGARLRWVEQRYPHALQQAIDIIRRTLPDALSVPGLASRVGLSPSRLHAIFQEHLGCAPLRYQQRLRMELACSLLGDPYLRIAEIGRRCGYADPAYFDRVFRRRHACTPRAWRARAGSRPPAL